MPKKNRKHKHTPKNFRSISEVKEAYCSPVEANKNVRAAYWKKPDPLDKVENPFSNKKKKTSHKE